MRRAFTCFRLKSGNLLAVTVHELIRSHSKPRMLSRNIRALLSITIELMQKYIKEDRAIGVDNLYRWSSNSDPLAGSLWRPANAHSRPFLGQRKMAVLAISMNSSNLVED